MHQILEQRIGGDEALRLLLNLLVRHPFGFFSVSEDEVDGLFVGLNRTLAGPLVHELGEVAVAPAKRMCVCPIFPGR